MLFFSLSAYAAHVSAADVGNLVALGIGEKGILAATVAAVLNEAAALLNAAVAVE